MMHVWEIMLSLSIGILGGIVSSVIVSRVFNIITVINDQLRDFEESLNKLLNIRGMLTGVKQVMEFTYDSELKKEKEIKQKGYESENEYYLAHNETRWIDADVLIMNLLNKCKKWGKELDEKIREVLVGENEIHFFYRRIHQVVFEILGIKDATFESLQHVDSEILKIEVEYNDYKKRLRKLYLKKIITDRMFLAISIVVICLIVITVVLFTNNI